MRIFNLFQEKIEHLFDPEVSESEKKKIYKRIEKRSSWKKKYCIQEDVEKLLKTIKPVRPSAYKKEALWHTIQHMIDTKNSKKRFSYRLVTSFAYAALSFFIVWGIAVFWQMDRENKLVQKPSVLNNTHIVEKPFQYIDEEIEEFPEDILDASLTTSIILPREIRFKLMGTPRIMYAESVSR